MRGNHNVRSSQYNINNNLKPLQEVCIVTILFSNNKSITILFEYLKKFETMQETRSNHIFLKKYLD